MILTAEDAIRETLNDAMDSIADQFRKSVRPIYGAEHGTPESIGSCILLEVDGTKLVLTAAHVTDHSDTHALFVAGSQSTEPIQIYPEFNSTVAPAGDRDLDKNDFAYWLISDEKVKEIGDVEFLDSTMMSANKTQPDSRYYLVLGFPVSKKAKKVNHRAKKISPTLFKYSSGIELDQNIYEKLGCSVEEHMIINYGKYSTNSSGKKTNSTKPYGISRGALFDMGSMSDPEIYRPEHQFSGYLSALMIEYHKIPGVMVSVKIGPILDKIQEELTS